MGMTAAVAGVVSAGASVYSAYSASRAAGRAGEIGEQIAQADAAVAKLFTTDQIKQRNQQLVADLGRAAAQYSASGVDVGSGSPLLAQNEILRIGLEDIESIIVNGQLDVYRAELGGAYSRQEAKSARTQAIATGVRGVADSAFSVASLTYKPQSQPTATVSIGGG